jgi:hypothetical protein
MATLVLTTAGQLVGGPVGGALGAVLGQAIDGRLFAPKARHGPRLGDLSVQTSSYGSQIPKLFGTLRVAGTVIWATGLKEDRHRSGGGKGRATTIEYSYSADFAVALSARKIRGVGRIWADGKLLRGAGGDFKSRTGFRLYKGDEDQDVDPLIASVEGIGEAPAYRGIAYAVFEGFELADYGNRIPSLTFEVEADEAPVSVAQIASELSDWDVLGGDSVAPLGYAAAGDSVRSAIETLTDLEPLSLRQVGGRLVVTNGQGESPEAIVAGDVASESGGTGGRSEWRRGSGDAVAGEASLAYYEPARDYQTGLQRAVRPGGGAACDRRSVAAALDAGVAKRLAELRLAAAWAGRRTAKVHLPYARCRLAAGTAVTVEGLTGLWRVARYTLERMVFSLDLIGIARTMPAAAPAASAGRPAEQPDLIVGSTTLVVFDSALGAEDLPLTPTLVVAAAGASDGWRRASIEASFDGGASWAAAGDTASSAVIGTLLSAPGAAGPALLDLRNSFEVELLNEEMWLESRSDAALASGANLAFVGGELLQFGDAQAVAPRWFRLSRLLRGRRGSEWAAGSHLPGEAFVLVDPTALVSVEAKPAALGSQARVMASGVGDDQPSLAEAELTGEALRPPSPVHLRAEKRSGGDVAITWARRSRSGWDWLSGSDTPLGEESESYRITISGTGFERSETVFDPIFVYTAAHREVDGAAASLVVSVVQIGTQAASRSAHIIVE